MYAVYFCVYICIGVYVCMCVCICIYVCCFTLIQTIVICFKISRKQFFPQCINLVNIHIIFMIWKFSIYKHIWLSATRDGWKDNCRCMKTRTKDLWRVSWNNIKGQIIKLLSFFEYFISLIGINFISKGMVYERRHLGNVF